MTHFTDEEFEASDPLKELHEPLDGAMLSMRNIEFGITHSHENESILFTQRFTKSVLTVDGFTQEVPHQVSIIIPLDEMEGLMVELIASAMCLTIAKKEGRNSHEA